MKNLNIVFTDKEFAKLQRIKGAHLTWHKFIRLAANFYRRYSQTSNVRGLREKNK